MTVLAPREAYRLWASAYEAENAITWLERDLVEKLGPSPAGRRLLDAGCGTGRRLVDARAAHAVGVDLSPEMLAVGRANPRLVGIELIEGDLRALPLPDGAFDLVWCRLAIGHLPDCMPAYTELARVVAPGASVIVTDFHPAAWAAGHRRTFRHAGEVREVAHYCHPADGQIAAACGAGLRLREQTQGVVGPDVRPFYTTAGREALYRAHRGLPVVLGLAFVRDG